jgi:hypothetical protein
MITPDIDTLTCVDASYGSDGNNDEYVASFA